MRRIVLAGLLALLPVVARGQTDQQALVDRSTLAVQDLMTLQDSRQPRTSLTHARAVIICPQLLKAGFFFGGAGGRCVLVGRAANGTWSYPAFYIMGGLSFGLQIGLQDSEVVFMVMTNRGLNAVLNNNFKIGAGASLAILVVGGGVQGDTTTALGADILAFMISRGAYAGVSLEGSLMSQSSGWDQTYYGQPLDARQLVVEMQGQNPGADPLRSLLTKYGTPQPPAMISFAPANGTPAYPPPAPTYAPPAYAAPQAPAYGQAPVNLQPNAPIQSQSLPPPR